MNRLNVFVDRAVYAGRRKGPFDKFGYGPVIATRLTKDNFSPSGVDNDAGGGDLRAYVDNASESSLSAP
ncbi:MAG TPA: hypothetical protein VFX54_09460, partial [Candidatus Binatia bacterium]|nr:hypothetical protein [Candidatus Binatia bacterium]